MWAAQKIKRKSNFIFFFDSLIIEIPEPPKSCELRNDTILEVVCVAGFDGGLEQHFLLEVVGGNPIYTSSDTTKSIPDIIDNEISTMNDQVCVFLYVYSSFFLWILESHQLRVVLVFMVFCCGLKMNYFMQ